MMGIILRCLESSFSRGVIRLVKAIINTIPKVAIWAIFLSSYKLLIINQIIFELWKNGRGLSLGIIEFLSYHFLGVLCMWSFTVASCSSPPELTETPEERQRIHDLRYETEDEIFEFNSPKRFCKSCNRYKPERAHHCSWCNMCVLKMDHHCPWLGNCVGAHNYKAFVLMLFYTSIFTAMATSFMFYNLSFLTVPGLGYHITLAAVGIALCFATLLLLVFHVYLLFTNRTTLECGIHLAQCWGPVPAKHRYDLGWKGNFMQVFGEDVFYWFLPMRSPLPLYDTIDSTKRKSRKKKSSRTRDNQKNDNNNSNDNEKEELLV